MPPVRVTLDDDYDDDDGGGCADGEGECDGVEREVREVREVDGESDDVERESVRERRMSSFASMRERVGRIDWSEGLGWSGVGLLVGCGLDVVGFLGFVVGGWVWSLRGKVEKVKAMEAARRRGRRLNALKMLRRGGRWLRGLGRGVVLLRIA
ncbi:hypothetical protein M409DRAFT_57448 [Zasmidium cellare ATCC 36951]|uniref:Transmembrane protein n=1 Tax=Zasmidium cellare ATCC 36951 TaxID=1080233 RepID=A0A6A6C9R4_ZASCE|nr:uncharacterized protein M409DRAFT_57448 [Zasmidium cellare ATCC 36951]KAF2163563.1 hypothetical protein M409DRAFT_57448 [Zasmidium cellare ATCC 36951]